MIISILVIRFVLLPICGIGIVTEATKLGLLPKSPLYRYVLLLQSTVPPAMSIGKGKSTHAACQHQRCPCVSEVIISFSIALQAQ